MSGTSSVGDRRVYEAGDQRNYKKGEEPTRPDYEQGQENSHLPNDSSEFRSAHQSVSAYVRHALATDIVI